MTTYTTWVAQMRDRETNKVVYEVECGSRAEADPRTLA